MKPHPQQYSQKRRRSEEDDDGSPRPHGPARPQPWFAATTNRSVSSPNPGLVMTEMKAEDAAAKYGSNRANNGSGSFAPSAVMTASTSAPAPALSIARSSNAHGTKESAIVVTDSETDTDPDPVATIEKDSG